MEFKKIGKLHNLKIWINGFDVVWKYTTYPSEKITYNKESSLRGIIIHPIRYFIWKIRLFLNKYRKNPKEQCEGCGEGWAQWMIDEPNGDRYSIIVCNDCVNFYDWRNTRKPLFQEIK
jgi:hypothetical protein